MSASKHRSKDEPIRSASTLDIEDFDPVSDGEPAEFEPDEITAEYESEDINEEYDDGATRSAAERLLSVATIILSVLLTAGSAVFWWYFVSRLSICPASLNNHDLYPVMLTACAAFSLAVAIGQFMRSRTYPSPENWMVNICVSGAVTALVMTVYNTAVLGSVFEWGDVLPTLCFTVSGCALPAAVYILVWTLIMLLIDRIRYENSKDSESVYTAVKAQCKGYFC